MDKEEQPRSSARIASQTSVNYAEPRRDSTWTDGEVQALACMFYTNKLKVGRFGPATVQHLVEMGKVWFLIPLSHSHFPLSQVPEELHHRLDGAGMSRWVQRNKYRVRQEIILYKEQQKEVNGMKLELSSDSEEEEGQQ